MIDSQLLYATVGRNVRKIRKATTPPMTQQQLASLLDVKRTSITNLEKGQQRIPLHLLYRLCNSLSLQLSDILPAIEDVVVEAESPVALGDTEAQLPRKTREFIERLGESSESDESTD